MSTSTRAARWSGLRVPRASRTASCRSRSSSGSRAGPVPSSSTRSRSSGSGSAARTLARRSRSRQALTTTRWSQVVTRESPRNVPARRNAATYASWRASAASSGLPITRSATAQRRSWWRSTSVLKAVGSPSTWAWSRAASLGWSGGSGTAGGAYGVGPSITSSSATAHDSTWCLVDPALVAAPLLGERGQVDQDVAGGDRLLGLRVTEEPAPERLATLRQDLSDPIGAAVVVAGSSAGIRSCTSVSSPLSRSLTAPTCWAEPRSRTRPTPRLIPPSRGLPL